MALMGLLAPNPRPLAIARNCLTYIIFKCTISMFTCKRVFQDCLYTLVNVSHCNAQLLLEFTLNGIFESLYSITASFICAISALYFHRPSPILIPIF